MAAVPCASGAEKLEPKILVINSDASVAKYAIAGESFKKAITYPVHEINLSDSKHMASYVKQTLKTHSYDSIYCIGTQAYMAAHKYAGKTDIIFSSAINWRRLPVNKNTYGVSNELHTAAQLMLFRYIFPDIRKIGIFYSDRFNKQWARRCVEEGNKIGIEIICRKITDNDLSPAEFARQFKEIDAFWLISDPVLISGKNRLEKVFNSCHRKKIPVFSYSDAFEKFGTVLTVSVDIPTVGRQVARMAQDLLSTKTINPKVQLPAGSHMTLNLKKVNEYGLNYSEDALALINRIIE